MKKKFLVALLGLAIIGGTLTACTEADKVSSNVSQEADNFNVLRRFAVINTRTDKVEFELVGAFSLETDSSKKVKLIVETEDGTYEVSANHAIRLDAESEHSYHNKGTERLVLNIFIAYDAVSTI